MAPAEGRRTRCPWQTTSARAAAPRGPEDNLDSEASDDSEESSEHRKGHVGESGRSRAMAVILGAVATVLAAATVCFLLASRASAPRFGGCELFPGRRIVLATTSTDYWDMFLNWLSFANSHLGATEQVVVIAYDDATLAALERVRQEGYRLAAATPVKDGLDLQGSPGRRLFDYGTQGYGDVVVHRPFAMLYLLRRGCDVLYSDIDMVWQGDPTRTVDATPHVDLFAASDACGPGTETKWENSTALCTGFLYLRPTTAAKHVVEKWATDVKRKNLNQQSFCDALVMYENNKSVTCERLPYEEHPPGCAAEAHPDATVLHANFMIGYQLKVDFFKKFGVWNEAAWPKVRLEGASRGLQSEGDRGPSRVTVASA